MRDGRITLEGPVGGQAPAEISMAGNGGKHKEADGRDVAAEYRQGV